MHTQNMPASSDGISKALGIIVEIRYLDGYTRSPLNISDGVSGAVSREKRERTMLEVVRGSGSYLPF